MHSGLQMGTPSALYQCLVFQGWFHYNHPGSIAALLARVSCVMAVFPQRDYAEYVAPCSIAVYCAVRQCVIWLRAINDAPLYPSYSKTLIRFYIRVCRHYASFGSSYLIEFNPTGIHSISICLRMAVGIRFWSPDDVDYRIELLTRSNTVRYDDPYNEWTKITKLWPQTPTYNKLYDEGALHL